MAEKKKSKRKQMSIAFTYEEYAKLDAVRGSIPRGAFIREMFLVKYSIDQCNIKQRVIVLKERYVEKFGEYSLEIGFTQENISDIERLTSNDLGASLVSQIIEKGAKSLPIFLGLKIISWNETKLSVFGEKGAVKEFQEEKLISVGLTGYEGRGPLV